MSTTFQITQSPHEIKQKIIAKADNGRVFSTGTELHIATDEIYYVYHFMGGRWYIRNESTGTSHYAGIGATPTIALSNLQVIDNDYWEDLILLNDDGN